jgi:hypothetical protein
MLLVGLTASRIAPPGHHLGVDAEAGRRCRR